MDHCPMVASPFCLPSVANAGVALQKITHLALKNIWSLKCNKGSRIAVLATGLGLFNGAPALAQFNYVTPGDGRPLIVFVHGLGGDAATSFKAKGSRKSWPALMREDVDRVRRARALRDYATATLSYPAKCSDRFTIPQAAAGLVRTLYDEGIWTRHPSIIFIGHSLGGLVIQEMLTTSQNDPRYGALVDRTAGAIFLATPVGGSTHANALAAFLKHVPGFKRTCPLLRDLRSIDSNAYLQRLDADWRKFIHTEERLKGLESRIRSICLYETKPLFGVVIVGRNASATVCDERLAMNEDHQSIAKPTSRGSVLYKRLRGLIADIHPRNPTRKSRAVPSIPTRRTARLHKGWGPPSKVGRSRSAEPSEKADRWPTPAEYNAIFFSNN